MAGVRWWLFALGVFVAVQSLIPWTPDSWRLIAILIGISFMIAAFPGYKFLFKGGQFATKLDNLDDDDDD